MASRITQKDDTVKIFHRLVSLQRQIESLQREITSKGKTRRRDSRLKNVERKQREILNELLNQSGERNLAVWRDSTGKVYSEPFPHNKICKYLARYVYVEVESIDERFYEICRIFLRHFAQVKYYWVIRKDSEIIYKHSRKLDKYADTLCEIADRLADLKPELINITPSAIYYDDGSMRLKSSDGFFWPTEEPKAQRIREGKFWIEPLELRILANAMRLLKEGINHAGVLGKGRRAPQHPVEHSCVIELKPLLKPRHIAGLMQIVFPQQPWTVGRIKKITGRARRKTL